MFSAVMYAEWDIKVEVDVDYFASKRIKVIEYLGGWRRGRMAPHVREQLSTA